jgi:hypothetical protein
MMAAKAVLICSKIRLLCFLQLTSLFFFVFIMQKTNRRPLGDIGNTYLQSTSSAGKAKLQAAVPHRIPSLVVPVTTTQSTPSSPRTDERNEHDPLHCTEYVKEIHENLKKREMTGRASPTYMSRIQQDINEKMRVILTDWIVDVHLKFKLQPETLFIAVEIIDRFLDKKVVSRQKLQLVGVVAMLLAAKYEEIYPPEVKDFIYISANTYSRDDILRMERLMFATLDFNLTFPTLHVFLKRALQVSDADIRTQNTAQFLAELSLMEYRMLQHPPSLIGASCVYVANKILLQEPWTRTLEHYTQWKLPDVERCAADLQMICQAAPGQKTQAVRKKFTYPKYGEVTKLIPATF